MPKDILIIKIGGSLLTYKDKSRTFRRQNTKLLCSQITSFYKANKQNFGLVIINGNGSFGHQTVKKYNIKNGFKTDFEKEGYIKLLQDTALVNRFLSDNLIDAGLPAMSLQTSAVFCDSGSNMHDFLMPLELAVEQQIVPVLYGEMILNSESGGSILGSDQIPFELLSWAKKSHYKILKVINLGSYAGVWDENKNIISKITPEVFSKVKNKIFYDSNNVDVSGGMGAKIESFLDLAKFGVDSFITSGLGVIDLEKIFKNPDGVIGTQILSR
ncbi:MAG: isopentenyl phosphate kinase [bacterium]